MFNVSYHESFISLLITISRALSLLSRPYISYKLINFELDENQVCHVGNVWGRAGIACPQADNGLIAGPAVPGDSQHLCSGSSVLVVGSRCCSDPASPAHAPQPGSHRGQQK